MRIRPCREIDTLEVGHLIAETYRTYNLSHADSEEQDRLLSPFLYAFSGDPRHQEAVRFYKKLEYKKQRAFVPVTVLMAQT